MYFLSIFVHLFCPSWKYRVPHGQKWTQNMILPLYCIDVNAFHTKLQVTTKSSCYVSWVWTGYCPLRIFPSGVNLRCDLITSVLISHFLLITETFKLSWTLHNKLAAGCYSNSPLTALWQPANGHKKAQVSDGCLKQRADQGGQNMLLIGC